ncbi:MAG: hypothetical protein ACFFBP_13920 [Promethearchaeota archaeon]
MAPITDFELITGISTLIFLIISILVALVIASKYFTLKSKSFLFIGLASIGQYFHYLPVVVNVIYSLGTGGILLPVEFNLLLGFTPLAIFTTLWYLGITELAFQKRRKIILIMVVAWYSFYLIMLYNFIFTGNASSLAEVDNAVKMTFYPPFILLNLVNLILWILPFFIFAMYTLKSDIPEIKLKGIFLLIALILYPIGTLIDLLQQDIVILVILARIIAIISALSFYLGLILPERVKKIFIK